MCVLATFVFHDGRRGFLYQFLDGFPLMNRPTLFFLFSEIGKSLASFENKKCKFSFRGKLRSSRYELYLLL
jgi:hypothetical protein